MTTDPANEVPDGDMTLMEHLTELRTRIIKSAIAVAVGAVICFIFRNSIIDLLIEPYCNALPSDDERRLITQGNCTLVQTQPLEGFSLVITIAAYGGLMLSIPVILWQAWHFVAPGLYPHERRHAVPFVTLGALLFFTGAGLAYWSIPRALEFLLVVGGDQLEPLLSPGPYIAFVVKMLVAFGLGFQFPLILVFLQMIGVVQTSTLRAGRRYAIVGIVVLVAVLTPSGDPFTLGVLAVPMYLFYEAALLWGALRERRQRKKSVAESV